MERFEVEHDPYERCEDRCTHDLARGVTVIDLLRGDGPHAPTHLIVSFQNMQAVVLDDPEDAFLAAG
jgi:hypothetical protein